MWVRFTGDNKEDEKSSKNHWKDLTEITAQCGSDYDQYQEDDEESPSSHSSAPVQFAILHYPCLPKSFIDLRSRFYDYWLIHPAIVSLITIESCVVLH